MEVLLALTTQDSVILAASKAAMRGVTILKATDDKTRQLTDRCVMAYSGEAGDTVQFAEFIQANLALYTTRNNFTLSTKSVASFTRGELARALRSRNPYTVNLLLAGVDSGNDGDGDGAAATGEGQDAPAQPDDDARRVRPKLYWIDYLASMAEVPYAAHGYAQYYCLSTLDKHHHPDMSVDAGLKLLRMCAEELRRRMPIDYKGLFVKVVSKDGVREVELGEDITVKPA